VQRLKVDRASIQPNSDRATSVADMPPNWGVESSSLSGPSPCATRTGGLHANYLPTEGSTRSGV
jgi:hypothetical protein